MTCGFKVISFIIIISMIVVFSLSLNVGILVNIILSSPNSI